MAPHGTEYAYHTLVAISEIKNGVMRAHQVVYCSEHVDLRRHTILTTGADIVLKSVTPRELQAPTETTPVGRSAWLREVWHDSL